MLESINPYTLEKIRNYSEHSEADLVKITDRSDKAYRSWRDRPFSDRRTLMHRAADVLRKNRDRYAETITLEMGKLIGESEAEVEKCAWVCDYYADHAEAFLADERIATDAQKSLVAFEPLGTILAVMPWNFPFWQVLRFAAPTIMAGNAALLKHASNVSGSALHIEELFREAGFPEDLFRTLLISSGKVEQVLRHPAVKAVTLTGSEAAGSSVASLAGSLIKKSVLELGGSDPFIVLEDADIPGCVLTSARARMLNTGQTCIAAKRFIVVDSRVEEFETMQTQIMQGMTMGDPMDRATKFGPMARPDLVDELHDQVTKSVDMGARVLCGGRKADRTGAFYEATVLTDVKPGMPVYSEETFGPVSAIIPVRDAEEAIAVANDSEFGLGASLWTQDLKKGEALARRIESGSVFVNEMTKSDPRLPFGGIRKSGYGRELSVQGIREFVNTKTIYIK